MFLINNIFNNLYSKITIIGYTGVIIAILSAPLALSAGPPPGADSAVWCEQNADECSEWCADNVEEEICQEPECD
jgi:hypothetical protein